MTTHHYPSDVTDARRGLIEPHLPPEPGGGRPRKTAMRFVLAAVLDIPSTGCRRRQLPGDLAAREHRLWRCFDGWRSDGTLDSIHDLLRKKVLTGEKPYRPRTSASVDCQSVDTTSGGENRGRDNAKIVDGWRRHIVVPSMGLLLAVLVIAASVDDAAAAPGLFAAVRGGPSDVDCRSPGPGRPAAGRGAGAGVRPSLRQCGRPLPHPDRARDALRQAAQVCDLIIFGRRHLEHGSP